MALDVAASELYQDGFYNLASENKKLETSEMVAYLGKLVKDYPIISIEDGLHEDDWEGWETLTRELGSKIQLVGEFINNCIK